MKKLISFILCLLTAVSLTGCSSKGSPKTEIAEGVEFEMLDVLHVINESTNVAYYYYLGNVTNHSDAPYQIKNLEAKLSDKDGEVINPVSSMDKYQSTITGTLDSGRSTSVYGYFGFPEANWKSIGLSFSDTSFVPFDSVKVRTIDDENIVNSTEDQFVIYEDEFFEFEVDASNVTYSYKNGVSTVSGLVLSYQNKTDERLVVPFLTPVCTIDGLDLADLPNPNKLKNMSLEELKKQDFSKNGLAPKTKNYQGEALNYQLYYLEGNQTVPCQISFTFKGIIPDFSAASSTGTGISIKINSASLGYSQVIKVDPV